MNGQVHDGYLRNFSVIAAYSLVHMFYDGATHTFVCFLFALHDDYWISNCDIVGL